MSGRVAQGFAPLGPPGLELWDRPREIGRGRGRAKAIEPETLHSFRLGTISPGGSVAKHAVNVRTLASGRSAPADLKKDAGGIDLPIGMGLQANDQVALDRPGNFALVGTDDRR